MAKARPTIQKRAKEASKIDKRREKAARRDRRRSEKDLRPDVPDGVDPDIADIVPGPQPVLPTDDEWMQE